MKKCSKCLKDKELSEYYVDKRTNSPRSYCKSCQKDMGNDWKKKNATRVREQNKKDQLKHKLKTIYKMTEAEYNEAVQSSGGKCRICQQTAKLFIDHCHETNQFRGLICTKCNTGLGMFEDDPARLLRAIEYLKG